MTQDRKIPTAWPQVLRLAVNDVRLTMKDRSAFLWMLLLPVALMWFFGEAITGAAGEPRISLTVEDRDGGWLARALIEELRDEQVSLSEVPVLSEGLADDNAAPVPRIRTLVLPAGMTDKVLAGEPQILRLELDPKANSTFGMGAEVHIRRTLVRVMGRLLETRLATAQAEAAANSDPVDAESDYLLRAARPPLVLLDVSSAGRGEPVPSGFAQSVPGNLTMIVLMGSLIYGGVFLIQEKQQGMLRRQMSLPITRGQLVAGKIAGRLLISSLQIVLLLCVARLIFGLSLGSSLPGLFLLTFSYALAVACLSILLGAVLQTTEQASTVGWILSMVLAGLGGCWWPSEVMPGWLQSAARVLPTSWAMEGFHALISFGRGVEAVWLPSLVLLGFAVVFGSLGSRWLRVV